MHAVSNHIWPCETTKIQVPGIFEQQAISCLKNVIKDAVLSVLDVTSETTLTNLVAEYAGVASSEDWSSLIDLLAGSCLALVRARVQPIQSLIISTQQQQNNSSSNNSSKSSSVHTPVVNICDQLHERLGKFVSLRSRPGDLALVSPRELEAIGRTIAQLTSHTGALCGGRVSASLGLSHTTLTVVSRLSRVTRVTYSKPAFY